MNILILGSGGREHALAWKISQSHHLNKLYIAPGNAGTAEVGENVPLSVTDFDSIKDFALNNGIDMLVVGPEAPLVAGIHDFFINDPETDLAVIGPQKAGAMLEGSKDFAKNFMMRHNIPTAHSRTFTADELNEAYDYLKVISPPYVLKADGLAAGKGVIIIDEEHEARKTLYSMLIEAKFGEAGKKVIIENFLNGIELSVFVLTDGKSYKMLPLAKDYKRIGEGDTGPNTGGMGSVSHVPFADNDLIQKISDNIIQPTITGLMKENILYSGFIFFGLMNVNGDPYVIEYNARMGDPEAEAIIPLIKSDLLELFIATANGQLENKDIIIDDRYAVSVMLASKGYPGPYEKGKHIFGLENVRDSIIFHAGTIRDEETNKIKTNGGRVLAITSLAETLEDAMSISYNTAKLIDFEGKIFRKDIGRDLLNMRK